MIIIAIDPGYERLGIAVMSKKERREEVIFSECFRTSNSLDFYERIKLIGDEVSLLIEKFNPEALVIEQLYFNNNQKTAIKVAEVCGIIKYISKSKNLDIFEYTPTQIKVAVSGCGGGNKKDVINMVKKLVKINGQIKYDDEYDAIATGLTHYACRTHKSI